MKKDIDLIQQATMLPNSLCEPFIQWLMNGEYSVSVKKDGVYFHKGNKVAVIYSRGIEQPFYKMNSHMIERFELFSRQWLKYGKDFLQALRAEMRFKHVKSEIVLD